MYGAVVWASVFRSNPIKVMIEPIDILYIFGYTYWINHTARRDKHERFRYFFDHVSYNTPFCTMLLWISLPLEASGLVIAFQFQSDPAAMSWLQSFKYIGMIHGSITAYNICHPYIDYISLDCPFLLCVSSSSIKPYLLPQIEDVELTPLLCHPIDYKIHHETKITCQMVI